MVGTTGHRRMSRNWMWATKTGDPISTFIAESTCGGCTREPALQFPGRFWRRRIFKQDVLRGGIPQNRPNLV